MLGQRDCRLGWEGFFWVQFAQRGREFDCSNVKCSLVHSSALGSLSFFGPLPSKWILPRKTCRPSFAAHTPRLFSFFGSRASLFLASKVQSDQA